MSKNGVYFPNLNGIRFIAALMVLIFHIEQFKFLFGFPTRVDTPFISVIGKLGVILFFVLSGYLITYLLLEEEKKFRKINIRQFYMRRILRIWPLYFFVTGLALLVLPHFSFFIIPGFEKDLLYQDFSIKAAMYFTLFANLAVSIYGIFPYASQGWSIGTEEQFYLIWPVLISRIRKNRMLLMVGIVIFYLAVQFVVNADWAGFIPGKMYIRRFWKLFNIDCMAIGGLFAVMLHQQRYLSYFLNVWVFYSALAITTILLITGTVVPYIHYEVYSLLFGILIVNFSANKKIGISLEHPVLDYLGKISYGLYMYHILVIVSTIKVLMLLNILNDWILYPVSIVLTILVAGVSYRFFESRFIRMKTRFSKIISGENISKSVEVTEAPRTPKIMAGEEVR